MSPLGSVIIDEVLRMDIIRIELRGGLVHFVSQAAGPFSIGTGPWNVVILGADSRQIAAYRTGLNVAAAVEEGCWLTADWTIGFVTVTGPSPWFPVSADDHPLP